MITSNEQLLITKLHKIKFYNFCLAEKLSRPYGYFTHPISRCVFVSHLGLRK
jgi:hypothetical protein